MALISKYHSLLTKHKFIVEFVSRYLGGHELCSALQSVSMFKMSWSSHFMTKESVLLVMLFTDHAVLRRRAGVVASSVSDDMMMICFLLSCMTLY